MRRISTDGANRVEQRISKQRLDRDIARLADRVAAQQPWRAVVGVANGGIYPAGKVADRLNLEYREIQLQAYRGRSKSAGVEIIRSLDDSEQGRGLLVVDDVVDSGDTALAIRAMLPRADFLSIYAKAEGASRVEASGMGFRYAERFPQDVWIVFPWHQDGWAGEVPLSVARYREQLHLDRAVPITRQ